MILEGIVTTQNADGRLNIAPMGPIVEGEFEKLLLRPFQASTTYQNLKRQSGGVFHVVDDARLLARAAIDRWDEFSPDISRGEDSRGRPSKPPADGTSLKPCPWMTAKPA